MKRHLLHQFWAFGFGCLLAAGTGWAQADDGSIVGWGEQVVGVDLSADFVAVAGGYYHSLGVKADGSIVAWGRNEYGQCDVSAPNTAFVAVAAGYYHSLGIKGCPLPLGDLNGDGNVDIDDLPHFVDALLRKPPAGAGIYQHRADMNADGDRDGDDIQPFVNVLFGPYAGKAKKAKKGVRKTTRLPQADRP